MNSTIKAMNRSAHPRRLLGHVFASSREHVHEDEGTPSDRLSKVFIMDAATKGTTKGGIMDH
jgi:hypothetical protein